MNSNSLAEDVRCITKDLKGINFDFLLNGTTLMSGNKGDFNFLSD